MSTSASHQPIQPEPDEDDFDIFAEAGEYKGMEYGFDDDSEEGSEKGHERPPRSGPSVASAEDVSAPPREAGSTTIRENQSQKHRHHYRLPPSNLRLFQRLALKPRKNSRRLRR